MAGFCVILSGRLPGDKDDASVWAAVRTGFKLDEATFNQRVLAVLPLLVRQNLDEATAERLTQQLRASGIDACTQPDDAQLAFLERAGTMRGPLPLSTLGTFIRPDERYRLRGSQEWRTWSQPEPALDLSLPDSFEHMSGEPPEDEAPPPLPQDDEPPAPPFLTNTPAWLSAAPVQMNPAEDEVPPPLPQDNEPPSPPFLANSPTVAEVPSTPKTSVSRPPFDRTASSTTPTTAPESANALDCGTSPARFVRKKESTPKRSHVGWWIASLAVVLIISGFFGWFHLHGRDALVDTHAAPAGTAQPITRATKPLATTAPVEALPPSQVPRAPSSNLPGNTMSEASAPISAQVDSADADHCAADAPKPTAPEEFTLLANGKRHLTGKSIRAGLGGEIYIVEAALGYDGVCRPNPYQIYVFSHGKLVGTLSSEAMQARTDGAINDFKLIDPEHLQVEIDHYKPSDPACCASSHEQRIVDLSQFLLAQPSETTTSSASTSQLPAFHESNAQASNGPSFDCTKARTPTDSAICADNSLGRLDGEQARLYRQAVEQASPDEAQALKDSQRLWLRDRAQCNSDKSCIEQQLNARIATLQNASDVKVAHPVAQAPAASGMTDQEIQSCETANHIEARTAEITSRLYGADYAAERAISDLKKRVSPACLDRLVREAKSQ